MILLMPGYTLPYKPTSREEAEKLVDYAKRSIEHYDHDVRIENGLFLTTGPLPHSLQRRYSLLEYLERARKFYDSFEDKTSVFDKLTEIDELEAETHYYLGWGNLGNPARTVELAREGKDIGNVGDLKRTMSWLKNAKYHFSRALEIRFRREDTEIMVKILAALYFTEIYERELTKVIPEQLAR